MFTAQNVTVVLTAWVLFSIPFSLMVGKAIGIMDKAPESK